MKKLPPLFHMKNHAAGAGPFKPPHFWRMVGTDPFVDWALILASSVLVAAILVAIGAYVYVAGAAALASSPPAVAGEDLAAHFDAQELGRIIAAFDARAAERVLLDKAYAGPSDPSLP